MKLTIARDEAQEPPPANSVLEESDPKPRLFRVPYEQNLNFFGREDILVRIRDVFRDQQSRQYNHRVALHGLGGVGKTQIALQYAYKYRQEYEHIFWVSAATRAQVLASYRDISGYIGAIISSEPDSMDVTWAFATRPWPERNNWLLIIDDLNGVTIIDGLLPPANCGGHTLITTRTALYKEIPAEGLEVSVMTLEESKDFFLHRSSIWIEQDASLNPINHVEKLVQELGCLPLAIEQAALFIRTQRHSIDDYLELWKINRAALLDWRLGRGNYQYPYTIWTTWDRDFLALKSLQPDSLVLIQLFAFLNPEQIQVDFVVAGGSAFPSRSDIRLIIEDKFRFQRAVSSLLTFSLISVREKGTIIKVHRLLQLVIQERLRKNMRANTVVSSVLRLALLAFPDPADSSNQDQCRKYYSQAKACLQHAQLTFNTDLWQTLDRRLALFSRNEGITVEANEQTPAIINEIDDTILVDVIPGDSPARPELALSAPTTNQPRHRSIRDMQSQWSRNLTTCFSAIPILTIVLLLLGLASVAGIGAAGAAAAVATGAKVNGSDATGRMLQIGAIGGSVWGSGMFFVIGIGWGLWASGLENKNRMMAAIGVVIYWGGSVGFAVLASQTVMWLLLREPNFGTFY